MDRTAGKQKGGFEGGPLWMRALGLSRDGGYPVVLRGYNRLIMEGLSSADGALTARLRLYSGSVRVMLERPIRRGVEEGLLKPNLNVSARAAAFTGLRGISYQWLLDPDFDVVGALLAAKHLVASLAIEPQ